MKGHVKLVNPTDHSSEPLELRPWLWVALGVVAIIGLAARIRDHDEARARDHVDGQQQVIVRTEPGIHVFPMLGIQVTPPEGWSYLSVADDEMADQPTFVNETADSIVSLRPFRFREWPPIEAEIVNCQYTNITIEWIEADHRRIGRFTQGDVDVSLLVMTHSHRSKLNESVEALCQSIELIGAGD